MKRLHALLSILLVALVSGAWVIKDTIDPVSIYTGSNTTPTINAASTGAVTLGPMSSTASHAVNGDLSVTGAVVATGSLGVATTTAPAGKLDVQSGAIGLVIGADNNATTRTDATTKNFRMGFPHYTNSEEPAAAVSGQSDASNNFILIGGGTAQLNSATEIRFYTATDATTVNGTLNGIVSGAGAWTLGATSSNVQHVIQNNGSGFSTSVFRNNSTSTSSDARYGIIVDKGSTTTTTSQKFVAFRSNAGGQTHGEITANGAGQAAYSNLSDSRLKENVVNLPSGQLAKFMAMRPVEFDYISGGHQIGFIAQEIAEIYPDAVSQDADSGMYSVVGYGKADARLIKALQEFKAEFDALKSEFEAYKLAHP